MLNQVVSLIKNNRLRDAQDLCEQLSHHNKKDLQVWLLLAHIYEKMGAFDKAENSYQKAIKLKGNHAPTYTSLAMLFHGQGKYDGAERYYKRSLKLDNKQPTVHFNLGSVLQQLGQLDEAVAHYKEAIIQKPDYAKSYANLGYIFRKQGKIDDAIANYEKALQYAPYIPEIHYNIGISLLEAGQYEKSEQHFRKAISYNPNYVDAWKGLGAIQSRNGQTENAIDSYTQALNKDPGNTDALVAMGFLHLSLGQLAEASKYSELVLEADSRHEGAMCLAANVCEKKGDYDQAYKNLAPLLQKEQPHVEAAICFLSISKSLDVSKKAIEWVESFLNVNTRLQSVDLIRVYFALGKTCDAQKEYDKAFYYYQKANKLKQAVFDINSVKCFIDKLIQTFPSDFRDRLVNSTINSERPIFIVGMPRSGTSLVEQILDSHPQITGAGELPDINNIALAMQGTGGTDCEYPDCVEIINQQKIDVMAQTYLNHLSDIDNDSRFVTDKMPTNFMHLGLIQLMFPKARIIHCIREPLDNSLSCYFNDFGADHPWMYDLHDIGRFYLEYLRIMQHWKSVLDIPILELHYESLVNNQEAVIHELIKYCDLEWDDSCMQFDKNNRFIWTASYDQVRKPMYRDSVNRWNNYESYIHDLRNVLEDVG